MTSGEGQIRQEINVSGHGTVYAVAQGNINIEVSSERQARSLIGTYERQSRETLLKAMATLCHNYKLHSLQGEVERQFKSPFRIATQFDYAPWLVSGRVVRPWERSGAVPAGIGFLEIVQDVNGLLVVGGPAGAGKSALLYELAVQLTQEAAAAVASGAICQLPILLPAATRYESAQFGGNVPKSFTDWIIKQAALDFNLKKSTVKAWLETGQLFLLIDDLSPLSGDQREDFVSDLNDFHATYGVNRIVIVTRSEDLMSISEKLMLHAIELQPLEPRAVDSALMQLGADAAGVRVAYQRSVALKSLLRSPIYVAALALGSRGESADELAYDNRHDALVDVVFDRYVSSMTDSYDRRQDFEPDTTRYFASSIADLMKRTGSSFVLALPDPRWIQGSRFSGIVKYGPRIWPPIAALAIGALGYLLGGLSIGLVYGGLCFLVFLVAFFGDQHVQIPEKWLTAGYGPLRKRRFARRRILNSPGRLVALTVLAVAVAALLSGIAQYPAAITMLPLWPLGVAFLLAAFCVITYLLVTDRAPAKSEFDDLGGGRDSPRLLALFGALLLLIAGTMGIAWLGFGLLVNWALSLPAMRLRLDYGILPESPMVSRFSMPVLRYLDHEFSSAVFGDLYLRPEWPWLWGLFGTISGLIMFFAAAAVMGFAFVAPDVALEDENRVPDQYRMFLHHLVRLTFMMRSSGRYSFTHPLIQDFFQRGWKSYATSPPPEEPEGPPSPAQDSGSAEPETSAATEVEAPYQLDPPTSPQTLEPGQESLVAPAPEPSSTWAEKHPRRKPVLIATCLLLGVLTTSSGLLLHLQSRTPDLEAGRQLSDDTEGLRSQGVCSQKCTKVGSYTFRHHAWGPSQLTLIVDEDGSGYGTGIAVVTDSTGVVRWQESTDDSGFTEFKLASPVTDSTGNIFAIYNPGRYDGITVFRPTRTSMSTLDTFWKDPAKLPRFYNAALVGPDRDGQYVIRVDTHSCEPSCAEGSTTSDAYRWNGKDYSMVR